MQSILLTALLFARADASPQPGTVEKRVAGEAVAAVAPAFASGRPAADKMLEVINRAPYVDRNGMNRMDWPELATSDKTALDESERAIIVADEVLPSGHRRVHQSLRLPISPTQLAQLQESGKPFVLDPQTGALIRESIRDYLPENWHMRAPDNQRVDSYGMPIVNATPGLPDWTQRDVDALREAIADWRDTRAAQIAARADAAETAGFLGNFIGQAITRGIAISDLVSLSDASAVDDAVAGAILGYLHFYENLRFVHTDDGKYIYLPTIYPSEIADFATAHGTSLAAIQRIEPMGDTRGGAPSGCYARTAFARGFTNLVGQTDIWVANGFDDESADIPTGFPLFFFYDCQDTDNNDTVRVSTNGYISFFQQGGGSLDGLNFTNDDIPNSIDPDGIAAPWWDDLIIATSQGSTDRVSYKTEGSIDSRVFTVEWVSVSRLDGSTNEFHYFQVKLFETTDVVELHFGLDTSAWMTDSLDNATTGLENFSGTAGDCGPNCLNSNNPPPPNNYRFTPSPRPDNDNCSNAVELINGASVLGNLHRATSDGAATCGDSLNNRDVWYTFVARCNGTLHVDTCGSRDIDGFETGIDTVLSIHTACPGTTANQLACSDDAGAAGCAGNDSAVSVAMVAGQRVFIRVTHFGNLAFRFASGAYRLNLNFVSSTPPANDNCAAATTILNGNTLIGNLLCASNDGSADCGSSESNPDIWYQFTAGGSPGTLRLTLCGSRNNAGADTGPDTVLSVHGGCPGGVGNELACNDDGFAAGCNSLDSQVTLALSPGQNVKIRVSHFGDSAFRVGNGVTALHADFGCARPCAGDVNFDGVQSLSDLAELLAHFGTCYPNGLYSPAADLNCDGCVTLQDLANLLATFGSPCP